MTRVTPAFKLFNERLYNWSKKDFREEINDNFSLLKSVKNDDVDTVLQIMNGLSKNDKIEFANGMIDRIQIFYKYMDITLTEKQSSLIAQYLKGNPNKRKCILMYPIYLIKKNMLKDKIIESLSNVFPKYEIYENWGDLEIRFSADLNDWILQTRVFIPYNLFPRFLMKKSFGYYHAIGSKVGRVELEGWYSITSWLGIGGGETEWYFKEEKDVSEAMTALKVCCEKFYTIASKIIKDIKP